MALADKVRIGSGTTISFETSGFESELIDLSFTGIERTAVDSSHMSSTRALPGAANAEFGTLEYIPVLYVNPGELNLEMHYNPFEEPIIESAIEEIIITFPTGTGEGTGDIYTGNGFCTAYDVTVTLEDKMMLSMTIRMSGPWAHTNAIA